MYNGYLRDHVELIRTLHERRATTREIAEALYVAGARTNTSEPVPHSRLMSREHHVANLRAMVLFVLHRLGLRRRRVRTLNLKASEMKGPAGSRTTDGASDSIGPFAAGRNEHKTPCPYTTDET